MKNIKNSTAALWMGIIFLGLGACAGRHNKKTENFSGESSANAPGIVTVRTGWVKDKKKAFNAELWFNNDSKKPIIVPVSRIACARANVSGSFRFAGYGAWMMELQPMEQKKLIAICETGSEQKGDWSFTFHDISEGNENGTAGKVILKELNLKLSPAAQSE